MTSRRRPGPARPGERLSRGRAPGDFEFVAWGTRRIATIERDRSGKLPLRFDDDLTTKDAPDILVYLDQHDPRRDQGKSKLIGELKSAFGSQQYDLPAAAATMLDYSVEIYCADCDKNSNRNEDSSRGCDERREARTQEGRRLLAVWGRRGRRLAPFKRGPAAHCFVLIRVRRRTASPSRSPPARPAAERLALTPKPES